jgi:transcriptional antiterminator NusG
MVLLIGMSENLDSATAKSALGPVEWYALHVLSGQENRIKKNIESRIKTEEMGDLIYQVIIPIEKVSEVKRGKKVETERKLYPGYVFVKMILRDHEKRLIDRSWYFIRQTNGVIGFADGESPLPMPKEQVESMLRQVKEKEDKVVPKVSHQVGDKVKV